MLRSLNFDNSHAKQEIPKSCLNYPKKTAQTRHRKMQFVCAAVLLHRLCVQDYVFQRCKLRKTVGKAGLDTFPSTLAQIKPRLSLMSYCCLCRFQTFVFPHKHSTYAKWRCTLTSCFFFHCPTEKILITDECVCMHVCGCLQVSERLLWLQIRGLGWNQCHSSIATRNRFISILIRDREIHKTAETNRLGERERE